MTAAGFVKGWPEIGEAQERAIAAATRSVLGTSTERRSTLLGDPGLAGAAGSVVHGLFVSLKRRGRLRSCRGIQGPPNPLLLALVHAAQSTACDDPRFPAVSSSELPFLECEVWLLADGKPLTSTGRDRANDVIIGTHGLTVTRGDKRGLLLPGVATEGALDARGFLQQACLKAGLHPDAWVEPQTEVSTFEGRCLEFDLGEWHPTAITAPVTRAELDDVALFVRERLSAHAQGRAPARFLPSTPGAPVMGLVIDIERSPGNAETRGTLALRTPIDLYKAVGSLIDPMLQRPPGSPDGSCVPVRVDVAVLYDTAMHGPGDDVDLRGLDAPERAVMAFGQDRFCLVKKAQGSASDIVAEALRGGEFGSAARAEMYSMAVVSSRAEFHLRSVPR